MELEVVRRRTKSGRPRGEQIPGGLHALGYEVQPAGRRQLADACSLLPHLAQQRPRALRGRKTA